MHSRLTIRSAALALAAAMTLGAAPAMAGDYPGSGPSSIRDPVTGYPCVDNQCTLLRVDEGNAKCLCSKQNPAEQTLRNLRLTCQTTENGRWVACPYYPRYGGNG